LPPSQRDSSAQFISVQNPVAKPSPSSNNTPIGTCDATFRQLPALKEKKKHNVESPSSRTFFCTDREVPNSTVMQFISRPRSFTIVERGAFSPKGAILPLCSSPRNRFQINHACRTDVLMKTRSRHIQSRRTKANELGRKY
jgi:hypothetical protein